MHKTNNYCDIQDGCKLVNKYRGALKEIRKLAEENKELLVGSHRECANNELILEVINEVENE